MSSERHPRADAVSFELCRPLPEHARLVMNWRNDPATLAASFHPAPKVWASFWPEFRDHYCGQQQPGPVFALVDGQRIGFLRFRPFPALPGGGGRTVDLSINLAPEWRGQGWGTAVLQAVESVLRAAAIDSVVAEVFPDNPASAKSFLAAGYRSLGPVAKVVDDPARPVTVERLVRELTSPFWRQGPVLIIAEAGSNWRLGQPQRDLAMGKALIDAAATAGADAVKFQTYRPETVYVANAGQSDYLAEAGIRQEIREIFADLAMPYEMLGALAEHCRARGVRFLSTGFSAEDFAAIDPWVELHKIASYEISHIRLLDLAAASGKPLVLSTGASDAHDIAWAAQRYLSQGGRDLCLMQCTAKYPAPLSSLNLGVLPSLRQRFQVAVGLSDHSRDPVTAPVAAVALGARCIEKHFTLHNALPGPDHSFALTPDELALMVRQIRAAEQAYGEEVKSVTPVESELASFARRGVQAVRDLAPGDLLAEGQTIAILRPGQRRPGVHPRFLEQIEGRRATRAIAAGDGLQPGDWA